MPILEIRRPGAAPETCKLTKQVPLLIGRLPTSDIQAIGETVAPVHCRISWNRGHFEVDAVTEQGVEWNGVVVQQAMLSPGDQILVGDVELLVLIDPEESGRRAPVERRESGGRLEPAPAPPAPAAAPPPSGFELKPVTEEELPVRAMHYSDELSHSHDPLIPEPNDLTGQRLPDPTPARLRPVDVALGIDESPEDRVASEELPALHRTSREPQQRAGLAETAARLRQKLHAPPRRPGEQELMRSPLVVGLGIGSGFLLLTAASIWFLLTREAAQREFDSAKEHLESGRYSQAIEGFEAFLQKRPRHGLANEARLSIRVARVDQPLAGATPSWDGGLDALNAFIAEYRDSKAFQGPESPERKFVVQTADRIAWGAAEMARTGRKRPLLAISADAVKLLEIYSPPNTLPPERLQEIAALARRAEAAVVQQEAFDVVMKKLDEALAADSPQAAFVDYRRLLDRYPVALDYKPLQERLKKAFDLERRRTTRDEARHEAHRQGQTPPIPGGLTLARRVRTRSDAVSVGTVVLARAADCLYGVDAVTADLLWRHVIGLDQPFAPVEVSASVPSVLTFDTQTRELILLSLREGELIWRLALGDKPQGAPLVYEGQVLLATAGGTLEQIDLNSGESTARLRFSQGLVGPPVVSLSGERLYVPGDANLLYVLRRRPLSCEQLVWTGHGPGAIVAPPLMMRSYLMLAENDQVERARLRLFDTSAEEGPPRQIAQQRIDGQVRDLPAVRGKQLVIPSSPERLTAFTVAETGDRQSLSVIGNYQVKDPGGAPIFVAIGVDDQLWMTSTALRRFTISRESLLPEKQELAVGIATQPLQFVGDSLYVGRRQAFSRAVLFSEVDRLRMSAQWQTTLGATVLECTAPSAEGATLCVTNQGELFQISPSRLLRTGFEMQSLAQVTVPEGLREALSAVRLSDGRLAIFCSGPESRVWLTGADGTVREYKLAAALEAPPVALGPGLLVPLEGRLRLFNRNTDSRIAEDLPAEVTESETARWRSVVAVDEAHALALTVAGRLSRVQYRTAPVAHLAEVTHWDAGRPVDQPLAVDRNRVVVTDTSGRTVLLNASSFEPLAEATLPSPAVRGPMLVGERVVVEIADGSLLCLDAGRGLAVLWDLPLDGANIVGTPLDHEGNWLIALSDGRVVIVSPADGAVRKTVTLSQRLAFGPQRWGPQVVVGTLDGTLLVLNNLLDGDAHALQ